jgi:hypothetical protein
MSAIFGSTDTELLLKEETGIVQLDFGKNRNSDILLVSSQSRVLLLDLTSNDGNAVQVSFFTLIVCVYMVCNTSFCDYRLVQRLDKEVLVHVYIETRLKMSTQPLVSKRKSFLRAQGAEYGSLIRNLVLSHQR